MGDNWNPRGATQGLTGVSNSVSRYWKQFGYRTVRYWLKSPRKYAAQFLVVGGGGAGGPWAGGGGGGAGGVQEGIMTLLEDVWYVVEIGAGGVGGGQFTTVTSGSNTNFYEWQTTKATEPNQPEQSGQQHIGIVIGEGGGRGGGDNANPAAGGSGGGAGRSNSPTGGAGNNIGGYGSGTVKVYQSQGSDGGNADSPNGGGGGGADAAGTNASSTNGGNGGAGRSSSISGSAETYGGGGGGGAHGVGDTGGTGGAGGGGNANSGCSTAGSGAIYSGGGGGGASGTEGICGRNSGNGGSGVVILSIPTAQIKGMTFESVTGLTPTTSTVGSRTLLTFTATGVFTYKYNTRI